MMLWQRWKQTALHNKALVLTSVLMAFGTLFYAGAAVVQLWLLHSSSKHTDEQIGRIIDNANWIARSVDYSEKQLERNTAQSAKAAADSIGATQQQIRLDERAWVGAANLSIVLDPSKPVRTEVRVAVLGKSPAINLVTEMGLKTLPTSQVLKRSDLVLDKIAVKNGTVFPTETFPVRKYGPNPVTPLERKVIQTIINKEATLYFFGRITYRDIFNHPHWTHFCFAITSGDVNEAHPCAIYNDSDADTPS